MPKIEELETVYSASSQANTHLIGDDVDDDVDVETRGREDGL